MSVQTRQTPLIAKLAAAWPPENWRDVTVLVAVSGGADSVALARGLHQIRDKGEGRLVLAHYNHRLRGAESDGDQRFVEDLACELGTEILVEPSPHLHLSSVNVTSPSRPLAPLVSESSLRDERYAFLKRAANQTGARYVATAHTADDQVETVLMNILRGTGLAGLAGILRVREFYEGVALVRPLLDVTRAEVLDYLQTQRLSFREDATNASLDYTRNRVRHELLPLLEREFNPQVRPAIERLSQIAREADDLVFTAARQLLSQSKRLVPEGVELQTQPLGRASDLIVRAALLQAWKSQSWPLADMSFERWNELLAFAREPATRPGLQASPRMFPGGIRAEKQDGLLRLTRPAS